MLAPLLYIIYKSELGPLLIACALLGQMYADDGQAHLLVLYATILDPRVGRFMDKSTPLSSVSRLLQ